MKKSIVILISVLAFFISIFGAKACSPIQTPFQDLLERYNPESYIIVEGYYQKKTEYRDPTSFVVTKSSDASIEIGLGYAVYEYGPFGNQCENYEMATNIDVELTGEDKLRLLILYKDRSINGKLVTPIFWEAGANISNNKIVTKFYDRKERRNIFYECKNSLTEVWQKIAKGNLKNLSWLEYPEK